MEGRIKHWNSSRGFGFAVPSGGGEDVFVHVSSLIDDDLDELRPGQRIQFEIGISPRTGRTEAQQVRLID